MKITTEDGKEVGEGDRVFNYYDMKWGTISNIGEDLWFTLLHDDGTRSSLDGSRVATYDPRETR